LRGGKVEENPQIIAYIERHMVDGRWMSLRDAKRRMHLNRHGVTAEEAGGVIRDLIASSMIEFETTSISRRKRVRVCVSEWHQRRHVARGVINMECDVCRDDIQKHADWCQTAQLYGLLA
jgi:predicted phage tail protein